METLLEWVGTLALLGLLMLLVPVFFMLIITLQFRVLGSTHKRDVEHYPEVRHAGERTQRPDAAPPSRGNSRSNS